MESASELRGLVYTSTWPGGVTVTTEIVGDVAQDAITYPRESAGPSCEITRKRELTALERHLRDRLPQIQQGHAS